MVDSLDWFQRCLHPRLNCGASGKTIPIGSGAWTRRGSADAHQERLPLRLVAVARADGVVGCHVSTVVAGARVVTVGDGIGRARIGEELAGPLGRGTNGDAGDREAHPSRIPVRLAVAHQIAAVGQHEDGMAVGGGVGQSAVDAQLRPVWSCRQSTSGRAVPLDHQCPDHRRDERGDQ